MKLGRVGQTYGAPKQQVSGSFKHQGVTHQVKKVKDGIIHTSGGKMFKREALEKQGVEFSKTDIPKRVSMTESKKDKLVKTYWDLDVDLDGAKYDLENYERQLKDLDSDMNEEAGQKGDDWTDDDANRYGGDLNDLEEKVKQATSKVTELEGKFSEVKNKIDEHDISIWR